MGRSHRYSSTAGDVLIMTLTAMKHAGDWDFLATMFQNKSPSFMRMITGFAQNISFALYDSLIYGMAWRCTMKTLVTMGNTFCNHSCGLYAVDVTSQQTNRPLDNIDEGELYYSA